MRGEERARLRAEPSLIPNNCCHCKLLHKTRRKLIRMVMKTMMVGMMMVKSFSVTKMIVWVMLMIMFHQTVFRTCLLLHLSFFRFLSCFHSILKFWSPQIVRLQLFSPVLLITTDYRQQPFCPKDMLVCFLQFFPVKNFNSTPPPPWGVVWGEVGEVVVSKTRREKFKFVFIEYVQQSLLIELSVKIDFAF